jgi:hypothetical protein
VLADVLGRLLERDDAEQTIDDRQLLAMGAYIGLLADWQPDPVASPTLVLRAREPLRARGANAPLASWPAEQTVELAGDHFSLVEEGSQATARATERWLSALCVA